MADPTLESLFQINKDGIRNKLCLEREMVEKLSRMIYKDPILTSILGKNKKKQAGTATWPNVKDVSKYL